MHSHLSILLPSVAFLSLGLAAPNPAPNPEPRGSLAILGLAAIAVVNSGNLQSVPDNGYDAGTTCTYDSNHPADVPFYAADPAWAPSMTACLGTMNNDQWNGDECLPNNGNGTVLGGVTYGFWKGENDFSGGVNCYNACSDCIGKAINAGQAETTRCKYEYKTHRLIGYKTHTCTMGYDKAK
jgi:hypothetical protein